MLKDIRAPVADDPDVIYRINRIRLAREYHCLPTDIDNLSVDDYTDMLHLAQADAEIAERHRWLTEAKRR